ncbi:DUF2316 family protein [Streptococcus oricebi]|uniref:DUF2316 domain-containing protein n=1 Tax=Streptococcus oricebi TaxID=1547447 RepID=A0ABS5B4W7_9STRE|nr:DUF2316 family protein [Streptococcus oricebi]MBP2623887.1 DUF2316 domain-containing protein [Streptococcus oricebi]
MLTKVEMRNTARELQENYRRLNYSEERVLADLGLSAEDLERVLSMRHPKPSHVWMLREYLEDMLLEEGQEVYPFSKLADPSVNLWYDYERPWRKSKAD